MDLLCVYGVHQELWGGKAVFGLLGALAWRLYGPTGTAPAPALCEDPSLVAPEYRSSGRIQNRNPPGAI